MTLTKAIRFYGTGTPEVMRYEDVEVGDPIYGMPIYGKILNWAMEKASI